MNDMQARTTRSSSFVTHEVFNQPPILLYDAWASDPALREAIAREGGGWAEAELAAYGVLAGGEMQELAFEANENKPKLALFDRYGNRLDEVRFHPAYHRLMGLAIEHGVNSFGWRHEDREGAHVARMGLVYLHSQADQGTGCPLTMTYACVPSLRITPAIAETWVPRVLSTEYDPRALPADQKRGATMGMGMTEKQGGSDVRTNTTRAYPLGARGPGELYEIVGHKWFFSAPMCDAFLVLAQTEAGPSCFLMPRFRPDGTRNAIRIQRLKDKIGDWSNASSEVELQGALGWLIGEEGRGIPAILEMVALTRQDCMIGSAAQMRAALVQAVHHVRHRSAFGKRLIDQPLMQNVLADLALESEAHTAFAARLSRAVDRSPHDRAEAAFCRIATAIGKYWICKRTPPFVNEAQECLGGIGYVEESSVARLYRQAPLNSIWEGSGNVQCLDVLRAARREPESVEALFAELEAARGGHRAFDREIDQLRDEFSQTDHLELRARTLVERLAVAIEASILLRAGNTLVAETFCESRLQGMHGQTFGTLPAELPAGGTHEDLIDRAFPAS